MSRLIDADVVLAGIDQIWDANPTENPYTDFGQALDSVSEIVEMAPTIDPVKHGKWTFEPFYLGRAHAVVICSECGGAFDGSVGFHYCGNCGAKMDGEP